jgi:formate--tetrahydrofolate ligase
MTQIFHSNHGLTWDNKLGLYVYEGVPQIHYGLHKHTYGESKEVVENNPSKPIQHTYNLDDSIEDKIKKIVTTVYKGKSVSFGKAALTSLKKIKELGAEGLPVCIAKTQFSFTENASQVGAAEGFNIHIENLILNSGAGFIVAVAGEIMRMPGLPKEPAAKVIDVVNGEIVGLS